MFASTNLLLKILVSTILLSNFSIFQTEKAQALYLAEEEVGPYYLYFLAKNGPGWYEQFYEGEKTEELGTTYQIKVELGPLRDGSKNGMPYISVDNFGGCASFIEFKIAHNGIPVTTNLLPQIEEVGIDGTYRTPEKYEFIFTNLGLYTAQFNGYIMCKEINGTAYTKFNYVKEHKIVKIIPKKVYPRDLDIKEFTCKKDFIISIKSPSTNMCKTVIYDPDYVADELQFKVFKASPMISGLTHRRNNQWKRTQDGWIINTTLPVGIVSPNQANSYRSTELFLSWIQINDQKIERGSKFTGTALFNFTERYLRFQKR